MIRFFLIASVALVAACSDQEETQRLTLTGSSTVAPVVLEMARAFESANPGTRIDVQTGGSSRGIADATSGLADIGMASRDLKSDEAGLVAHRIAVDGIAVIAHSSIPIENLTTAQLVSIYTGETNNWSELGGPGREIVVVNKAEGRGTLEVFLGFTGLDSADVSADLIVGENQQAIKTITGNPAAIGYVSIGAAEHEIQAGAALKLLNIDGVATSSESVAAGKYPISRPLHLLTRGEPSALAREFINFAQSTEVHPLILGQLYVPIFD